MRQLHAYDIYYPPAGLRPVFAIPDGGQLLPLQHPVGRQNPRQPFEGSPAALLGYAWPAGWSVEELVDTEEAYSS